MEEWKIIFDTDCLSSFLWVDEMMLLKSLFQGRIYVPDAVVSEISKLKGSKRAHSVYQRFIDEVTRGEINIISVNIGTPENELVEEISALYSEKFGKQIGSGELHMLALAKIMGIACTVSTASNNFKDISWYAIQENILNITTMDIFCLAYEQGLKNFSELQSLKETMILRKRFLPPETVEEYYKNSYKQKNP